MSAGDQRSVGKPAAHLDGLDDSRLVGGGRAGRRAFGAASPVRQVVTHRQPTAPRPLVANLLQQFGIAVATGTVGQYDDALWRAFGFVRDTGDLVESS